jgi:diguanylate cyclase (GGDEF)-like protein/PAS domain S-box-containing protein
VLQLKWKHQFQFAGFYAAQQQGYFAAEGLEVELREIDKGSTPAESVLRGDAQYGISDSSLVLQRLRGQPLVVLAAIFQHSPMVLMTTQASGITSPLQLKGKKVMYRKNIDDAVLLAMFTEAGLGIDQHQHVSTTFNHNSLLNGDTDAMAGYTTNQPYYYQQMGVPINILAPANYGIDFYGDMIFVEELYLKQHKQQALAFRRASVKGWAYALEHPEEIIDWMLANLKTDKGREHLLFEAERTARLIQPELIELGYINPNRFRRITDIYKKQQLVDVNAELQGINYLDYFGDHKARDLGKWLSVAGIVLLAFFLVALVLWVINYRLKAQVSIRTRQLQSAHNELGNYLKLINRYVITSTIGTDGRIQVVSDALCFITGFSQEELVGNKHEMLQHPDHDADIIIEVREQIKIQQFWSGEITYRSKYGRKIWLEYEVAPLLDEHGDLAGYTTVYIDITVKKDIETLSLTDSLTGLPNRRQLDETINKIMASAERHQRPFSLVLMDLDKFKLVNDNYGHQVGDDILQTTGKILLENTRKGDTAGRWGGEEFLIVCPESDIEGALQLADYLRNIIEHHQFDAIDRQTCSFGVAQWTAGESYQQLLVRCDRALYKAKEQGRNCVVNALPQTDEPVAPPLTSIVITDPQLKKTP